MNGPMAPVPLRRGPSPPPAHTARLLRAPSLGLGQIDPQKYQRSGRLPLRFACDGRQPDHVSPMWVIVPTAPCPFLPPIKHEQGHLPQMPVW